MIICDICGRDIDAIGQDNMSATSGVAICEDCYGVANNQSNDEYDDGSCEIM